MTPPALSRALHATPSPARPRRRTLAAVTALALAGAALLGAAPASAAETPTTITGKVTFPAGTTVPTSAWVVAYETTSTDWRDAAESQLAADGTFTLTDLDASKSYDVAFNDTYGDWGTGYYTTSGKLVPRAAAATHLRPGATGLVLNAVASVPVAGTVVVAAGATPPRWWTVDDATVVVLLEPGTQRIAGLTYVRDGYLTFSLGALPGGSYDLAFGGNGYVGYYAGVDRPETEAQSGAAKVAAGTSGLKVYLSHVSSTAAPKVSGTAKVGDRLSATTGSWSLPGKATYQWLRNGAAIARATGSTYVLAGGDYGKKISVRVTWHPTTTTYGGAAATSASTAAVARGAAPVLKKAPKISGTVKANHKLTASAGTWSVPDVSPRYQWLRNGKAISGATSARYTVSTKDVGKRLSVRVTAKPAGRASASAKSAATKKVGRGGPKVVATLSTTKAKARSTVKVTVTVQAKGLGKPTGTITVTVGGRVVHKTVKASAKGKVTLVLPKLSARGTYKVTTRFTPSGSSAKVLTAKSASAVKLRIV